MAMITTPIPDVNGAKSVDQKIEMLLDNYFILRKEIEYGMQNVDFENLSTNFNKRLTDNFGNVAELILTSELFSTRLGDAEGNISSLSQISTAIELRVSDAEGNISSLIQTSNSLSSRITDAEGNISTVIQTSETLTSRITTAEGNISTVTQTASSLSSRLTTAEGNISTVTQTANSLTTRISDAEGNISTIQQTTTGITAAINATELVFDNSGLTVKNGGFKIMDGSTKTVGISSSGVLELGGGKIVIYSSPSSSYEVFKADSSGNILLRNLYVLNPYSVTSGIMYTTQRMLLKVTSGLNGQVVIGDNSYSSYYDFRESGTYNHIFRGNIDLGLSSNTIKIKGFEVVFDSNGFLKKA